MHASNIAATFLSLYYFRSIILNTVRPNQRLYGGNWNLEGDGIHKGVWVGIGGGGGAKRAVA